MTLFLTRLFTIALDGRVKTLIGGAGSGFRDGDISVARLCEPRGMCLCTDGAVLIADSGNHRIRRLDHNLVHLTTIAGCKDSGAQDGPGTTAKFRFPSSVVERRPDVYLVADQFNHTLR